MRPGIALDERFEFAPRGLGDVQQRAEWARREERVAGAPQDPDLRRLVVAELPCKSGLPYSCLARDDNETALATGRFREGVPKHLEGKLSLEQAVGSDARRLHPVHPDIVERAGRRFKRRSSNDPYLSRITASR